VKIKLDENLSRHLKPVLSALAHDVDTTAEEGFPKWLNYKLEAGPFCYLHLFGRVGLQKRNQDPRVLDIRVQPGVKILFLDDNGHTVMDRGYVIPSGVGLPRKRVQESGGEFGFEERFGHGTQN
jgi:hypothetical protein